MMLAPHSARRVETHYQGRVLVYLILLIIFFRIFFLGVLQCTLQRLHIL